MSKATRALASLLLLGASLVGEAAGGVVCPPPPPAPPQGGPDAPAQPTVDQILDRYVQAVGSPEAFGKLKTRVRKGKFEIVGAPVKGEAEDYAKAPNMRVTITRLPGLGLIEEGYDGKVGWTRDPNNGLRERSGSELAAAVLDAEFNREVRIKQLYQKLAAGGVVKVNGRDAYLIVATPAGSQPEKLYFDKQTGLLVRMDVVRESPQGAVPFAVYFDDYREVDKVKLPFVERHTTSDFEAVIRYDSVVHNVPVEDAKFAKPASK
jgi:hypothetical protein